VIGCDQAIEIKMQRPFDTLSEKDKRRYADIEATKLGYGSIDYISKLFDVDPKTIRGRIQELELADDLTPDRIRKKRRGQENRP
jgi:hypothetical protein